MTRSGPTYETSVKDVDDWRDKAECARTDNGTPVYEVEMWFPIGDSRAAVAQAEEARWVCDTLCTVRAECKDFALERREQHGVWGGMTEKERDRYLRAQGRARRAGQQIRRDY